MTLTPYKPTLFEAIETGDQDVIERCLKEMIAIAVNDDWDKEDLLDLLAAHEILPGSNCRNWLEEAFALEQIKQEREACD